MNNKGTLLELMAFVILLALFLLYGYLVSVSNLPDWFKFFLLK